MSVSAPRAENENTLPMQKDTTASDPDNVVVPLRRPGGHPSHHTGHASADPGAAQEPPGIGDLDRYPDEPDDADDYRHRMITNIAGIGIALALIVTGVWIANTMASMRKNQDCVLSGRRGCTPVEAPAPQRW